MIHRRNSGFKHRQGRLCYQHFTIIEIYCKLIFKLCQPIKEKRHRNCDTALSHTFATAKAAIDKIDLELIRHSPYSQDPSPSEYWFSKTKSALAWKKIFSRQCCNLHCESVICQGRTFFFLRSCINIRVVVKHLQHYMNTSGVEWNEFLSHIATFKNLKEESKYITNLIIKLSTCGFLVMQIIVSW